MLCVVDIVQKIKATVKIRAFLEFSELTTQRSEIILKYLKKMSKF